MIFVIDSGIAGDIGGLACLKAKNVDIQGRTVVVWTEKQFFLQLTRPQGPQG